MKKRVLSLSSAACAISLAGLVACEQQLDGPKPALEDPVAATTLPVEPGILCRMQHPDEGTKVIVRGTDFSPVPYDIPKDPKLALPTVTLSRQLNLDGTPADGATLVYEGEPGGSNSDLLSWESREQLTYRLVDELDLDAGTMGMAPMGVHDVAVQNQNDNEAVSAGAFAVIDRPHVQGIDPDVICVAQSPRTVMLTGRSILRLGDDSAVVRIDGQDFPVDTMSGCIPIPHDGLDAELCDVVATTIPEGALSPGLYEVLLANPDPADCVSVHAEDLVELLVVPPPAILRAEPSLMCTDDGSRGLVIRGAGFVEVDSVGPSVILGGTAVPFDSLGGCSTTTVNGVSVRECDTINLTVPQGTLNDGAVEVTVTNPDPAGCAVSDSVVLTAPPTLTLASAEPNGVCGAGGVVNVTVHGTGFLRINSVDFIVRVEGTPVTPTLITDCTSLTVDRMTVQSCDTFVVPVDTSAYTVGPIAIAVDNPTTAACDLSSSSIFAIAEQPVISGVVPSEVCEDESTTLTISGTALLPSATVVATHTGTSAEITADMVVDAGGGAIDATWNAGFDPGLYDITVVSAPTCEDTQSNALTVRPLPFVFFVDPPTVFNGVGNEVTIFTSGLPKNASAVELIDSSGTRTDIAFTSPARANRILATIPQGLTADSYEVAVTSDIGCVSSLNGTLDITDATTLTLEGVIPSFVSPTQSTAVIVTRDTAAAAPNDVDFISTPRIYLNPVSGAGSASGLRAVEFGTTDLLNAVIPGGLESGIYDVIVVNPTGEVGILSGALTVTVAEPPVISAVTPGSISSSANAPVTIFGENFSTGGVQIETECRDGAVVSTVDALSVTVVDSGKITATVQSSGFNAGTVCVVRLINAPPGETGPVFEYSAISLKNSAANLEAFSSGTSLLEARRGLSVASGRPTNTSRYIYAIGGDDGDMANAKTSVEATAVDIFGDLAVWDLQRNELPAGRTMAGAARVGRFVYLVGGHDGTSAVDTVLRAEVLNPLDGPEVVDVDASLAVTGGLTPGLWIYRVAATFPGSDDKNPNGESLPGDVFNVQIPAAADGLILTLTWDSVPGATGYRLYRTPAAGDPASAIELLAATTDTSYTDDNATSTTGEFPLPRGSLGTWHAAGTLTVPRRSAAIVALQDPGASNHWFVYAFGGQDASTPDPAPLDTYEVIEIDIEVDGTHTVAASVLGDRTLDAPVYGAAAWTANNNDTTNIAAGTVAVYVGGGADGSGGGGGTTGDTRGGLVDLATGLIVAASAGTVLDDVATNQPQRGGTAYAAANGYLYLFGGYGSIGGAPAAGDSSCSIVDGTTLGNWSGGGGGVILVKRGWLSATKESAFFYAVGGADESGNPMTTVEQTVQ